MADEQQVAAGPQDPEFAAILNQARAVDAQADEVLTGPKPDQVAAEVVDPIEAWAQIPAMVGGILGMALPELKPVYNPQACREWGKSMHLVAIKRGWSADGLPPEVGAVLASAMFVVPTIGAIKKRQHLAKQQQQSRPASAAEGVLGDAAGAPAGGDAA